MSIGTLTGGMLSVAERLYVDAVGELVAAESQEAEAFLVRKNEAKPPRSDWEARAMAALDTGHATTIARAALVIAENRMRRENHAPESD